MDNKKKLNVRARAHRALARTFTTLFILFTFSIFGTTSFASVTMSEETAEYILNYFYENVNTINNNTTNETAVKETLKTINPNTFKNVFNETFNEKIGYTGSYTWQNVSVVGYYTGTTPLLTFILSNNTAGDMPFLEINNKTTSAVIRGRDGYATSQGYIKMVEYKLNSNENIESNFDYSISMNTNKTFTFNDTNEILYYSPLLAFSQTQIAYYAPNNGNYKSYFLGNYYNVRAEEEPDIPIESGDTGESGDIGGGGTGGDTGGGTTTPDYSEDLENIQTGITDINNNIGETNNKLDNIQNTISGETEKIKDTIAGEYSGEIEMTSGDILDNMGYNPPNDPNQSIWDTLIKGLQEALTGTGNVTYEFEFRGKKYSIKSEDIKQPEGALKTYTGLVINFILLMQMVTFIKKCIDQVAEGDLKVMHTADADCYFF